MKYALIILVVLTSACDDNAEVLPPATWGEAGAEIAAAVCDRLDECGAYIGLTCEETIVSYICGMDGNCETEVSGEIWDAAMACTNAIEEFFCPILEDGYLPAECADFWTFEPEPVEPDTDVNRGPGDGGGSNGRGKGGQ